MTGEWRITDGDRHSAVTSLGEHYAAGRLDRAEFDERSERAYAAKTDQDLRPLFVDLPAPHGPTTPLTTRPPAPATPFPVYRRSLRGFPFPLLPLVLLVLFFGLHLFWVLPLVLLGFWALRGRRHWHAGPTRRW